MSNKEDSNVVHLADRPANARARFLEQLFTEHQVALRRFLRMRLLPEQDREDILQDLFLRLADMEDIQQRFAERPEGVRNYLLAMAVNLANDKARRASVRHADKHDTLAEQKELDGSSSPEDQVSADRDLAAAKAILMKLGLKQRNAFVLNRFKCLSYPEIARMMNVSVSSVEKYISDTLYALRKEIE